jgi:peptidoglycan/LPS O-acetylase OafA/YrhL
MEWLLRQARRLRGAGWRVCVWVWDLLRRAFGPKFRKIVAEFFLEVGVLWFVFPTLDTFVQFGRSKVTKGMTLLSIVIAFACLILAGLFTPKEEPKG